MDPDLVASYDELPLWSAPFGLVLLDKVPISAPMTVLDIGCGTGFPLLELAQRLGPSSRVIGVDPWRAALSRCRDKARCYGASGAHLLEGRSERLPFGDGCFDLIVSNNGLNNVSDQRRALAECFRVAATPSTLVATMNLPDTMHELYAAFGAVLAELGRAREIEAMQRQIATMRKPRATTEAALGEAGFAIEGVDEHSFTMRFASAAALFSHHFIRLAFLPGWRGVVASDAVDAVFERLAARLDDEAAKSGELRLTIPFACYVASKRHA
ncbi:MAG: methyltransferase domain-containing protein [Myxococcales bacterium]|nr:methyltransferase domain-containing protein [Myxococcales bacterium]